MIYICRNRKNIKSEITLQKNDTGFWWIILVTWTAVFEITETVLFEKGLVTHELFINSQ